MWSILNLFLWNLFDHFVGQVFLFVVFYFDLAFLLVSHHLSFECVNILTLSLLKITFVIGVSIRICCCLFFGCFGFFFICDDY